MDPYISSNDPVLGIDSEMGNANIKGKKINFSLHKFIVTQDNQTNFTLPFSYVQDDYIELRINGITLLPTNEKTGSELETCFTIILYTLF